MLSGHVHVTEWGQKVASEYIAYMMLELTVDKLKGTGIYVIESMISEQALIIIPSQDLETIMQHRQSRAVVGG
jgi:hypothetical protein